MEDCRAPSLLSFLLRATPTGEEGKEPCQVGEGVPLPADCRVAGTLGPAVRSRSLFSGPDTWGIVKVRVRLQCTIAMYRGRC